MKTMHLQPLLFPVLWIPALGLNWSPSTLPGSGWLGGTAEVKLGPRTVSRIEYFSAFLKRQPKVPTMQRAFTEERVDEFKQTIQEYVDTPFATEEFPVPFLNYIHMGLLGKDFYIIDGQHRFRALEIFYNEHKVDFKIPYVERTCENVGELKRYFRDINNHFKHEEMVMIETEIDAKTALRMYLREKYPKHLKNTETPNFPNVHVEVVIDFIIAEMKDCNDADLRGIINYFDASNAMAGEALLKYNAEYHAKASPPVGQGLYIRFALEEHQLMPRKLTKQPRGTVSKALRETVFHKAFGDDSVIGSCKACGMTVSFFKNYECGHIKSVKNGGKTVLSNLVPLCKKCNRSMGADDFDIFRKQFN